MDAISIKGLLELLLVGFMAIIAFFTRRLVKDLDDTATELNKHGGELSAHKLHVSENYATKTDVMGQYKMIHDDMKEIKSDIKTLIRGEK